MNDELREAAKLVLNAEVRNEENELGGESGSLVIEPQAWWAAKDIARHVLAETPGDDGVSLIASERRRQVESEGWTLEHDDQHEDCELSLAAVCYANPEHYREHCGGVSPIDWPWESSWWKPTPNDRIRELAKAGALIAAEIDRLQREALAIPLKDA